MCWQQSPLLRPAPCVGTDSGHHPTRSLPRPLGFSQGLIGPDIIIGYGVEWAWPGYSLILLRSVVMGQLPVQGSLHPYCCAHSSQVEPRFLHHIWEARLWFNLLALQDEDLPVETFSSLWIPCTGTDPDPIPLSPSYLATWRSFLKLWLHRNSVSFQLVFQENCSIQRCIFDMFMGVRELHVFLFHCLDPLPCFHIFLMVQKIFSKNDILRHEKIIWNSNFRSSHYGPVG